MSKVLGRNMILSFYSGGFFKPFACALNCTLNRQVGTVETTVEGAGDWETFEATRNGWDVQADGIVSLEETNQLDLAELDALMFSHTKIFIQIERTSITNQFYKNTGYVLFTNISDTGVFNGMNTFSMNMKGTGILNQEFVPSPITPPGMSHRIDFPSPTVGTDTVSSALLIGKEILEANKDGVGYTEIITTGTPAGKQAKYISAAGTVQFSTVVNPNEQIYIVYQDM